MADLSQVNSPADLIKYNESVKPVDQVEKILNDVYECSSTEGMAIARDIVETLAAWHKSIADELLQSDPQKAAVWIQDLTLLNQCIAILDDVAV